MNNLNKNIKLWYAKLKKGNIGEDIVKQHLIEKYPEYDILAHIQSKSHWIDFIIMNKENLDIKFCEVKTKEKWRKFDAIGFDEEDYKYYVLLHNKTGEEIFIYFVEELKSEIRLLKLSEAIKYDDLGETYRHYANKTVNWYINKHTKFVSHLSDYDKKLLKEINEEIKNINDDTYN